MAHERKAKTGIYGRHQVRKKIRGGKEAGFVKTEIAGPPNVWLRRCMTDSMSSYCLQVYRADICNKLSRNKFVKMLACKALISRN